MGFFDDIQGAVDRGMSTMERGVEIAKINARMREINQQRSNLAAQLGACLYERTKNDPSFTEGLETLYSGIARLDSERIEAQAMIEQLQNQPQQKAPARQLVTCPTCGSFCDPTDMFCCGCGAKVADFAAGSAASAAAGTYYCPKCSAPFEEGDAFCMSCGARLASELPAAEPVFTADPAIEPELASAPEPAAEPQPIPEPEPELSFVRTPDVEDDEDLELTLVMDPAAADDSAAPKPEPAPEPAPHLVVESYVAPQSGLAFDPFANPFTQAKATPEPAFQPAFQPMADPVIAPEPTPVAEPKPEPAPEPQPQLTFQPMGAAGGSSLDATLQPFLPLEQQGEPAPKPAFEPLPLQTMETLAASQPVSPNITPETAASASERPVSGLIFDSPVIPSTPEPEPEPQPSANPQRRFCPECGKVITPGDRFCMICGCNLDGIW
ncbi:MAG: zinc ribbon domain-containing protein [Coriobacteriaceae bacterium]|nr:zinc ribbon domain-containing protein [Coriobacteriaceae bacterium]